MTRMLRGDWGRILLFAAAQVVIISGIVLATSQRWAERQAARKLPPLRERAIVLKPLYDDPRIVTDEQLEATLRKLYPRLRGPEPKINFVDHALRCWGPDAVFDDPDALSGAEMRDLLLNHERFAKVWPTAPPFLKRNKEGDLEVRTKEGLATASHDDHTLASIAESGISRDYPVVTSTDHTTFGELVEGSLKKFSLDQMEYEWSILAYTLLLPPATHWITSEGQQVSFDSLADRLMREALPDGVCFANHRLHSLVVMLRVDAEVCPILKPTTRERMIKFLTLVSQQLVKSQHAYGYWDSGWVGVKPQEKKGEESIAGTELRDRIIATGHALEWLASVPEEIQPPREVVTRAAQWLIHAVEQLDAQELRENYAFATHAGTALARWRGTTPAEFMKPRLDRSKLQKPADERPSADGARPEEGKKKGHGT